MKIEQDDLKDFLENASWYHTIDFPNGLSSKGVFDHRNHLNFYKLPESFTGKEVLDVGCSDGFFSFEIEKRGAQRVLAVDTNKFDGSPAISPSTSMQNDLEKKYSTRQLKNSHFTELAKKLDLLQVHTFLMTKKVLGSNVEYRDHSIYNLKDLNQTFDVVFCGDLIEHLKNPIEAVEQLSSVTKELCIITIASLTTSKKLNWWLRLLRLNPILKDRVVTYWGDRGGSFFHFSPGAFEKLLKASGFARVEVISSFDLKNLKTGMDIPHVVYHCWKK